MTRDALKSLLLNAGLPAGLWQLPDKEYEPVSDAFVLKNWAAWVAARPDELTEITTIKGYARRCPKWLPESGDCDNLAIGSMAWADTGNALAAEKRKQKRGGLAYGTLFYVAGPARADNFGVSGGHAINWYVRHSLEVMFFEPGVGEIVNLTQVERSSAWFGIAV